MTSRDGVHNRAGSRLIAFSVLLLAGINGVFAVNLWVNWHDRLEAATQETQRLAQSVSEHAARTVASVDQLLTGLAEVLQERMGHHNAGGLTANDPEVTALLRRRAALVPYIRAVTLLDGHGIVLNDSRVDQAKPYDLSDRAYFLVHRDGGRDQLFIDTPAVSRIDDRWFFGISRRITDLGGHFAGVLNAVADPRYFEGFYGSLGVDGTVTLFDSRGLVYSRAPGFEQYAGQRLNALPLFTTRLPGAPDGSYHETDGDGRRQIVSYRSVPGYPLVVMITESFAHALAPWRQLLWVQLLVALLANAAGIAFTTVLLRQIRRLEVAAHDLRISEARATGAQRQLVDAIESMTEGFALFDREERLVLFNSRYRKMVGPVGDRVTPGVTYEDLLQAVVASDFVSEARADPEGWVKSRLAQHRSPSCTAVEQELSTGEWVLAWIYPTVDGGRVHIRTDITSLKRQQLEVAHQELVLRTTVENIVQGLCVFDRRHRLILWNRNWLSLLQLPAEFGRIGLPLAEVVRWRAARGDYGRGDVDDIVAYRMAALSALDDHIGERVLPNGTAVEVRGVPMPGGGRLTTYNDITKRRSAQLELRQKTDVLETTLESVDQGIAMFDRDFRLIAANRRHYMLLGFPEAEFPLGTPFESFLRYNAERGEFGLGNVEELMVERLRAAQRLQPYSFERTRPDGTVIEARRMPTPQGGFVTTYTDITERKQREDELQAAKAAAERTSEVKSLFLAKMSHELRTPFNAIIGFAEIIAEKAFGQDREAIDTYANYAQEIRASARHLLDLVNNILDISKIESGRMAVSIDRFDLRQTLNSSLSMMRELGRSQGVTLVLDATQPLPDTRADERAVKQIVTNLLSNALKFTPEGGRITLRARPTPNGGFEVAVSDTGVGIPADQIGRVLLPFEQGDNRYSRSTGGTGLGLALVKGLIDLHGGVIRVESEVGRGTTVSAIFPSSPLENI